MNQVHFPVQFAHHAHVIFWARGSLPPWMTARTGRGPGLTDEHQQSSSHGGTMRKVELQHYLVGHGDGQGPRERRQQAQGPHGHVATVFWKSNHTAELTALRTPSPCTAAVFSHSTITFTDSKMHIYKTGDHISSGVHKPWVRALK